jgi:redox-sensitive bicupin YhaK (pirin superfamily)
MLIIRCCAKEPYSQSKEAREEKSMVIEIRKAGERGYFDHDWLKSYHTFSYAEYEDPTYRGFHSLRVINENRMRPGTGFPVQAHVDIEIFSIVTEGRITHQDDLGNGSILRPGHISLFSAGKGITHSECNASDKEEAHFWQFWIIPADRKLKPSYQEKFFSSLPHHQFNLVISSDGREGSLHIHQNVDVYLALLDPKKEIHYDLAPQRYGWIQVMEGEIEVNGFKLERGDGASVSEISHLHFKSLTSAQFVLLDLV